jgi:hypothetical protein
MAAGATAKAVAIAAASTPSTDCSINGVRMFGAIAGWAQTSISSSRRSGMTGMSSSKGVER